VQLQVDNRTIDIDDEGYLVDPADWSEAVAEALGQGSRARRRSFELVPYGYVRQACKVAGMRRPRAWSTG
jgi:sulfur relay (sulfurtransferase) DsrC/TusE family protein